MILYLFWDLIQKWKTFWDYANFKENVVLDEAFFDNHILRLHDEGWYRGTTTYAPLIIEKQGCALKLVSGPNYQPSFQKGLYSAQILQKVLGVNKVKHIYKFWW